MPVVVVKGRHKVWYDSGTKVLGWRVTGDEVIGPKGHCENFGFTVSELRSPCRVLGGEPRWSYLHLNRITVLGQVSQRQILKPRSCAGFLETALGDT